VKKTICHVFFFENKLRETQAYDKLAQNFKKIKTVCYFAILFIHLFIICLFDLFVCLFIYLFQAGWSERA